MDIAKIYVPARNLECEWLHVPENLRDAYMPVWVRKELVEDFCASPDWEAITDEEYEGPSLDLTSKYRTHNEVCRFG